MRYFPFVQRIKERKDGRARPRLVGELIAVGVGSFVVSTCIAPFVREAMLRSNTIDRPNHRSSHHAVVPRGGGLACLFGVAAGVQVCRPNLDKKSLAALLASGSLALVGFADDRSSLPVGPRLAAQLLAGSLAIGTSPRHAAAGAFWTVSLVNIVNFMDGINGISSLTMLLWGVNAASEVQSSNCEAISVVGAAAAGAALGFLPHNLRRNRMFLGDVGSYLFGGLVGLTAAHPRINTKMRIRLLAPLSIYFADTSVTLVRRLASRKNIFSAHREHVYQQLAIDHGLGHLPVAIYASALGALVTTFVRNHRYGPVLILLAAYLLSPTIVKVARSFAIRTGPVNHKFAELTDEAKR